MTLSLNQAYGSDGSDSAGVLGMERSLKVMKGVWVQ